MAYAMEPLVVLLPSSAPVEVGPPVSFFQSLLKVRITQRLMTVPTPALILTVTCRYVIFLSNASPQGWAYGPSGCHQYGA